MEKIEEKKKKDENLANKKKLQAEKKERIFQLAEKKIIATRNDCN